MEEVKDRLKKALDVMDMTAADLARKSGINKGAISRYLKGEVIPKRNAIGFLAEALGVSPSWLMGYDVPMMTFSVNSYDDDHNKEIITVSGRQSTTDAIALINGAINEILSTLPSGGFHGGEDHGPASHDFFVKFAQLSEKNQEQAMNYITFLLENQKTEDAEKKGAQS